jgi:2-methylcitrate dehydratase PrpD
MTITDDVVDFIRTASPPEQALVGADDWPAVTVAVSSAAAIARSANAEGERVAIAVGSAVADAVAAALDSTSVADRWSRQSVAGVVGAGAALGRLMKFDDDRLRHLLGLCATQAAGLRALDATETGTMQIRKAAADAVEAAQLVAHGFTSSAAGLDGRRGLLALMAPGATFPGQLGGGWITAAGRELDDESDRER